MSIAKILLFIVCFVFITGCASRFDGVAVLGDEVRVINKQPESVAATYLANKTVRTYSSFHGNQIEYFSPNGRAYLWYPGNRRPVPSFWKLRPNNNRYEICFKYPTSSYNPATKDYGGYWECQDLAIYAKRIVEIADTDLFKLATGRLPFRLSQANLNFIKLKLVMDSQIKS